MTAETKSRMRKICLEWSANTSLHGINELAKSGVSRAWRGLWVALLCGMTGLVLKGIIELVINFREGNSFDRVF